VEEEAKKGGAIRLNKLGSSSTMELHSKLGISAVAKHMPPASVMTHLILIMVWQKLIRATPTLTLASLVWFGLWWRLGK